MLLFWERGFEGASMADLTQAMGLNPSSIYAAFGAAAYSPLGPSTPHGTQERWPLPEPGRRPHDSIPRT